jgi:hypothetical protein
MTMPRSSHITEYSAWLTASLPASFVISFCTSANASAPFEIELSHVRHVAQADALARSPVLRGVAAILHRARESLQVDDRGGIANVLVVQRSVLHGLGSSGSLDGIQTDAREQSRCILTFECAR